MGNDRLLVFKENYAGGFEFVVVLPVDRVGTKGLIEILEVDPFVPLDLFGIPRGQGHLRDYLSKVILEG